MLNNSSMPAYTTREVRNYGLHTAGSLYKYLFTREENLLLNSGAIKLFPYEMCTFTTLHEVNLSGKIVPANEILDYKDFDDNTLKVLIKTNVIKCVLSEQFKDKSDEELVKIAKVYDCVGKTFKEVSETLDIDFEILKDKFELKQGGKNKKVQTKNIETLNQILVGV